MSIEVMRAVFKAPIRPSTAKFVALALADNASDDTWEAWPSITTICLKTSQDRKTVIRAIDRLEKLTILSDTGRRIGKTMSVKIYRFNLAPAKLMPFTAPLQSDPGFPPEAVPDIPLKRSRISGEAVPKTGHRIPKESSDESPRETLTPANSLCEGAVSADNGDLICDFDEALQTIREKIFSTRGLNAPVCARAKKNLRALLPLPRNQIELLAWFHARRLPQDEKHPDYFALSRRFTSEDTLLAKWSVALMRASQFREKNKSEPAVYRATVAPDWRAFFWRKYPGCCLPPEFHQLASMQIKEWKQAGAEFVKSGWWLPFAESIYGVRDDWPALFQQLTPSAQKAILDACLKESQGARIST